MRKNLILSRELLLAAVIFVSAAAIITGTILSTVIITTTTMTTSTTASAASQEEAEEKSKSKEKTTANANEKSLSFTQSNTISSSLPLPIPSTTTTSKKSNNNDVVTTQGTLSSESALASTDIVNSVSTTYEVLFTTATTATISKVLVTFPSGFGVSNAKGLEVSGMGSSNSISSTSISGQTITFNINSPVSVSADTKLRIEVGNIKNPINAASNYQVSITTKRSDDTTIDGPTTSSAFSIRKVGSATISDNSISTSMIRNGAVTGSKIAGTSKLVFVECTVSYSSSLNPGDSVATYCYNFSVANNDAVVATQNEPVASCIQLKSAGTQDNSLFFIFKNECNGSLNFVSKHMSAIVFKATS